MLSKPAERTYLKPFIRLNDGFRLITLKEQYNRQRECLGRDVYFGEGDADLTTFKEARRGKAEGAGYSRVADNPRTCGGTNVNAFPMP